MCARGQSPGISQCHFVGVIRVEEGTDRCSYLRAKVVNVAGPGWFTAHKVDVEAFRSKIEHPLRFCHCYESEATQGKFLSMTVRRPVKSPDENVMKGGVVQGC